MNFWARSWLLPQDTSQRWNCWTENKALRHIFLRKQRRGKWNQSPFDVVSAFVVRLAFILILLPKTMLIQRMIRPCMKEIDPHYQGDSFWFYTHSTDLHKAPHMVASCTLQFFIREQFWIFLEVWRDLQSHEMLIWPLMLGYAETWSDGARTGSPDSSWRVVFLLIKPFSHC